MKEVLKKLSKSWRASAKLIQADIERTKGEKPTLFISSSEMKCYEQAQRSFIQHANQINELLKNMERQRLSNRILGPQKTPSECLFCGKKLVHDVFEFVSEISGKTTKSDVLRCYDLECTYLHVSSEDIGLISENLAK